MNHLAHALLAGDDEWLQLGSAMGDFVRGQPGRLGQALQGIGRRLRRDNPLATALPLLAVRDAALQTDFEAFFPQLQAHAREGIEAHAG
ncbi:MAG TPA: ACP phosphodiesterase [Rhodanobacter sp.]|nr:ACP phosphodiesterase [Rhodanobacter sp.]